MVKQLSTSNQRAFIPEWDGNSELPVIEQIKVQYKAITVSMKEKLLPRTFNFEQDAQSKEMLTTMSVTINRKNLIKELVTSIENCAYMGDDGKEHKIVTVDQLFDAPVEFDGLIEEMYEYFNKILNQKVNEKN